MTKAWGTICLVRPDWDGEDENMDQAVVEAYEPAKSFLEVAPELWRLAGDDERADRIEALVDQVYERDRRWMTAEEIEQLIRWLDGIEAALVGKVVDEQWMVRPDQLPALRAHTKTLDLDERRGELACHAVGEGIGDVCSLRSILREAVDRGLLISLD
ncbi:MAG: hypothetical protein MJE77_26110 [Proteobacteria bacterium]|nr:hypothetical protein [Pseudomonadota bacterium]